MHLVFCSHTCFFFVFFLCMFARAQTQIFDYRTVTARRGALWTALYATPQVGSQWKARSVSPYLGVLCVLSI